MTKMEVKEQCRYSFLQRPKLTKKVNKYVVTIDSKNLGRIVITEERSKRPLGTF